MGAASERQQDIDRQRPVRQPPGSGHFRAQVARSQEADRAEPAGRGDGPGKLMSRQAAAHAGLNDRQLHSESLQEARHAGELVRATSRSSPIDLPSLRRPQSSAR